MGQHIQIWSHQKVRSLAILTVHNKKHLEHPLVATTKVHKQHQSVEYTALRLALQASILTSNLQIGLVDGP